MSSRLVYQGGPVRAQGLGADAEGNIWISSYENDSVYVFLRGNPHRCCKSSQRPEKRSVRRRACSRRYCVGLQTVVDSPPVNPQECCEVRARPRRAKGATISAPPGTAA